MPTRIESFWSPVITVICAWCQLDMGTKPCSPAQAGKVSHSICAACLAAMEQVA
jgi:hypothetical protein